MAIDRATFLEIVKDAYSAYYTILPVEEGQEELPLAFRAEYNVRDEQYFFVKSANIWKNEKHEYCFVFSAPSFDPALAEECIDFSLKEMLPKVKPHKEHQYTNIKTLFLASSFTEDALQEIRRRKFQKSYGFLSTEGYSNLITTAVDVNDERVWTNSAGRDMKKYFTTKKEKIFSKVDILIFVVDASNTNEKETSLDYFKK